ncbi:MAG: hypothetical protein ABL957_14285 [Parvularculaceae bacterium]
MRSFSLHDYALFIAVFFAALVFSVVTTTIAHMGAAKSAGVRFRDLLLVRVVYATVSSGVIFVLVAAGVLGGLAADLSGGVLVLCMLAPLVLSAYVARPIMRAVEKIGPMKHLKAINDRICAEIMRRAGYVKTSE